MFGDGPERIKDEVQKAGHETTGCYGIRAKFNLRQGTPAEFIKRINENEFFQLFIEMS